LKGEKKKLSIVKIMKELRKNTDMEINSFSNLQNTEDHFFEIKIKEFLDENEKTNQDVSVQRTEISAEVEQSKSEIESNDQELSEVLNRRRKIDSDRDKIIYKQELLIKTIVKMKNELNRNYIKEYTELYNISARKEKDLKLKVEGLETEIHKVKKESEEKVKKANKQKWIIGLASGLVCVAFTALICYLTLGGSK
jgi:hypothetical protein